MNVSKVYEKESTAKTLATKKTKAEGMEYVVVPSEGGYKVELKCLVSTPETPKKETLMPASDTDVKNVDPRTEAKKMTTEAKVYNLAVQFGASLMTLKKNLADSKVALSQKKAAPATLPSKIILSVAIRQAINTLY